MILKKIGVLYHPMIGAAQVKAEEIKGFLDSRGLSAWMCSSWEKDEAMAHLGGTDLILSVGGDGTILRAAQVAVSGGVPITGINLGKLGFMTELGAGEALEKLPALLAGEGWIEERAMLQVERESIVYHALNDVVMARGAIARVVHVEASIDGQHLTNYKADGVILATATGSTGYALAAGGPVLYPQSKDFVLVPIMPHLSSRYAVILPESAVVTLNITSVHQATLSIDGHINLPLSSGGAITVKRSPNITRFLRIRKENYFYTSLEERLKGKQ